MSEKKKSVILVHILPPKNPQKTSGMHKICYGTYLFTTPPRYIAGIYIYIYVSLSVSASLTAYAIHPQPLDGIKLILQEIFSAKWHCAPSSFVFPLFQFLVKMSSPLDFVIKGYVFVLQGYAIEKGYYCFIHNSS